MQVKDVDELLYGRIENICSSRLKHTVTPYDVLKWLDNFKKIEHNTALSVLKALDVYTENELVELWDERLKTLFEEIDSKGTILINPIAEYGKSGTLMIYYIKKTPTFSRNRDRILFLPNPEQIKYKKKDNSIPANSYIVLVDDFTGSGNSLLSHYLHFIKQQISKYDRIVGVFAVSLFCLQKAINLIERKAIELQMITELRMKAFSSRGSVFGSREKMIVVRDFCIKYGLGLWITENPKNKKKTDHCLGYENSQALIVFPYNPPNNTLPIIWSDKGGRFPLYPRRPDFKISEAKKVRQELAYYISLLKHTDFYALFNSGERELPWKTYNFITRTDFRIFAIMFFRKQRRPKPTICQILGITEGDYVNLVSAMKTKDLIDNEEKVTLKGDSIYRSVLYRLRKERAYLRKEGKDVSIRNVFYLPKQFKGKSSSS